MRLPYSPLCRNPRGRCLFAATLPRESPTVTVTASLCHPRLHQQDEPRQAKPLYKKKKKKKKKKNCYVGASDPGLPGYESLLSQLIAAVAGKGIFYFIAIGSILAVLALFRRTRPSADFPRLCQIVAEDGYLPDAFSFARPPRRLVFSYGIFVLACLSGLLLIVFRRSNGLPLPAACSWCSRFAVRDWCFIGRGWAGDTRGGAC